MADFEMYFSDAEREAAEQKKKEDAMAERFEKMFKEEWKA